MDPLIHTMVATGLLYSFYSVGVFFGKRSGWKDGNLAGIETTLNLLDEEQLDTVISRINLKNANE